MSPLSKYFFVAAVVVCLGQTRANAQTATQVQELQARIAELQQARGEFEAGREAHRQQVGVIQRQIEQLREDRQGVQPLVEQQQRKIERLMAERDAAASQVDELQRQLSAIADAAQSAATAMLGHVQRGIPFERPERTEAVSSVQQQLASDDLLSRAGGIEALASLAGEELQLMRTREVWNAPLMLDDGNRRVEGYHARLGLVSLYFISEDGATVGATHRGDWTFDLDPQQRQSVIRVIRMLQGQRPPGIINVPLAPPPTELGNRGAF